MGELFEEMVLHGPEAVKAHLLGKDCLIDRIADRPSLFSGRPGARHGNLGEEGEFHGFRTGSRGE
jgi:hypothetical protein